MGYKFYKQTEKDNLPDLSANSPRLMMLYGCISTGRSPDSELALKYFGKMTPLPPKKEIVGGLLWVDITTNEQNQVLSQYGATSI